MPKKKNIYLFYVLILILFSLTGCGNKGLTPIETYEVNEQGDLVGDNFKIEYNENNDIVLMESGTEKETFDYKYNDDGTIQYIGIDFSNDVWPDTKATVTYYDYDNRIFLLYLSNDKGYNVEQYYLYSSDDELKYIIQRIFQSDGILYSEYLTEFEYFTENNIEYILEKTYDISGNFISGRAYTKQSTAQITNNLEKLGITTSLMYAKGYNKLNYQSQLPNIYEMPNGTLFYSSKVLSWVNNNKLMIAIYDPADNYIYTRNTSMVQTLYKENDVYYREILSHYGEYYHRTYKYILNNGIVSKLEVYEEIITESEYNKLKEKYEENNKNIDYVDVSDVFAKYINSKATNIENLYNRCMSAINSNWNNYEKYKNSSLLSSSNDDSISDNKDNSSINKDKDSKTNNDSNKNSTNKTNSSKNTNLNNKTDSSENNDSENNTNSNMADSEKIPSLDVKVYEWAFNSVHVDIYTDTKKCKGNIYLNGSMALENISLSSLSFTQETLENLNVGINTIKVELLKDNKVLNSKEITYNFDYENIPTPKLGINTTYNTYDSKYTFILFTDHNGCTNDYRCKLELYVNGEKQANTYNVEVPLVIGENTFKIELKNLFGKTACKKVVVTRFKYNPDVLFTYLGDTSVSDC